MGKNMYTFARVESKYLISKEVFEQIKKQFTQKMILDNYGTTKICNIYYDNDNYDLIHASIEKPIYKEKLRLRSYDIPKLESQVFLEMKKKFAGVVYKRRISGVLKQIGDSLSECEVLNTGEQIANEISYVVNYYDLKPKFYISYDRQAYYAYEDKEFRITIDSEMLGRCTDLDLMLGSYGENIISEDMLLMEVKANQAFPKWFVDLINQYTIYPVSFSKVGTYYRKMLVQNRRNNQCLVVY